MSSYLSPVIQHNDQRIFVKGSIKEKEIDFLLDTGAEITVIPTKLAQGLNIPYKKTKLCLTGVIGEDSVLYETPPIEVQFGPKTLTTKLLCAPLNTGAILGMDLLRQINLTLDMSSESTSIKISSAQISTNNATPPEYAFLQNHPIWAKDKDDCGLLTGVEPVKLTGTPPPVTKQYPINKEAIQGIKLIVENLLTQGVLVTTNSPCNSPIWPIKKSNGTWRLTIDYRVANKNIDKITPLVADPSTICNGLPLDCKIFSVIDMSNGFFSVPLHSDSQPWLAFTVDYEQYQWTRLPQGFQNSPTIYHQAVRRDLCDPECPVKQSTMIQYVDDILIASTDHEVHQTELASLLDYLHKKGHKCSFHKAQIAKKQVTFLGQTIGAGNRSITQDRAASVKAIPPPTTIKTLRSFLGTTGYCRPWIEDYASIAQPLYDLLKGHGKDSDTVCMEELHLKAFNDLKRALCQAPVLASHAASSISYTHTSMGALRFVTWNVNGAGSKEKKLKIFSQLKKLQADVVLLQETHRPATATDQLKTTEFPNVFTACYNSRQRGVAIVIHKNVNFTVLNTVIDPEGRFLIIKLSIFDKKLCIVSIYGPNVDDPSFFHGFFTALSEQLDCALVIGGDLNFGLNKEMDRLSTAGTQRNWESTNIVKQYMSDYGLCDAWRSLHTNSREFTFFSHVHHSYSRLDYFLVSSSLLSDISDTEIHPIAVSDHAAVSLTLVNKKASPPSNNWRFNTSLLKDDDFIKYFKEEWALYLDYNDLPGTSASVLWKQAKL